MTPEERIAAISELISQFENATRESEQALLNRLTMSVDSLLSDPLSLNSVLREYAPDWQVLMQSLMDTLGEVFNLNSDYFADIAAPELVSEARTEMLGAVGITAAGVLLSTGYLATIYNDTTRTRSLINVLTDAKLRDLTPKNLINRLRETVRGKANQPGIHQRLFDTLPSQPHVQADRTMQYLVGDKAGLRAMLYLGGLIDSSRDFCRVRNRGVYLREEIQRFGTPKDAYGGYVNKSTGYFAGKPRTGYDPFTDCGGHSCRHHWNVISNAEALRRRDDIEEVNGALRVKKNG